MIECQPFRGVDGGRVPIGYEVTDRVAVITIDRPERGNSLDHAALTSGLPAAWRRAEADDAVAVVVLTATGDRYFCSGVDVRDPAMIAIATGGAEPPPIRITSRDHAVGKPVIVAVNGRCTGGGLMLIADGDIVLAATNASFDNPGVSIGIAATMGGVVLSRTADFKRVLRLTLTGSAQTLDAAAALDAGMVSEVVAPDALQRRALELARQLTANSPAAMREAKRVLWGALEQPLSAALVDAEDGARRFRTHPDASEGLAALRERRPPAWAPYSSGVGA
jgi:enoyl-CoA hydratase/carnithine racemase